MDDAMPPIGRRSAGLALGSALLAGPSPEVLAQAAPPGAPPVAPPDVPPAAPPGPPLAAPIGVTRGVEAIGIMGGPLVGTFTRIADDIARFIAVNSPQVPRVIPMVATGGPQVAQDLLSLNGVDGAVVSAVVMDVVRRAGWLPEITQRAAYVSELYVEETHIVASTQITNMEALNGRVVNVGAIGGGTEVIARRLFQGLDIRPVFDNRPTLEALRTVSTGDPAAVVFIAGKPVAAFQDISVVGNLHFVPVRLDARTRPRVEPLYRPTVLEHTDYPRFIPRARTVPTVASSVFLVTRIHPNGSERQAWISRVMEALVQNLVQLRAGAATGAFHPKWREVNVLTPLPGFGRSPEVTAWFNSSGAQVPGAPGR